MDINKYIGICLVKNGYCCIPSLGILRMQKKAAAKNFNGEVIPPSFSIEYENVNSIDDQFAHFIGIVENISSNNASNALSKFGKGVKEQVLSGTPYIIEGLGEFRKKGSAPEFIMSSNFNEAEFNVTPPNNATNGNHSIDNTRIAPQPKEQESLKFTNPQNTPSESVGAKALKSLLPILLIAAIGAGGYFGYKYMQKKANEPVVEVPKVADTATAIIDTTAAKIDTTSVIAIDSTKPAVAVDTTKSAVSVMNGPAMKVAIFTFSNQESADVKCKKLVSYGNPASVVKGDSSHYHIVISLASTNRPADKVQDSLRKLFNPSFKPFEVK
jgi:hypothetical protein